jgi:hypothetical protein
VTRKHLFASIAVALAVLTGAGGVSNLAAHAAPSPCQTTVLQQTPVTGHNTTHGYLYLMRDLCDGNVFLRESTDLWGSYLTESLSTYWMSPAGQVTSTRVTNAANLQWGGHVDTTEVPYTSGTSYSYYGYVNGFWGDTYYGGAMYTAP